MKVNVQLINIIQKQKYIMSKLKKSISEDRYNYLFFTMFLYRKFFILGNCDVYKFLLKYKFRGYEIYVDFALNKLVIDAEA